MNLAYNMFPITFRSLTDNDFSQLHAWLNADFVARWYHQPDLSLAGITAKYSPYARGEDAKSHYFIIEVSNQPVGMIQWYRLDDYPQYREYLEVEGGAVSVDLFIGERRFLHKGIGPRAICAFLREIVFPAVTHKVCYIGPEQGNIAAIRAYSKAGFRHMKIVAVPGERDLIYLMRAEEEQLARFAEQARSC